MNSNTLINTNISIDIQELAKVIRSLSKEKLELLEMEISGENKTILKRFNDVKMKRVKLLSKKEVFRNV